MVVTAYLFLGFLIALSHEVNSHEDPNLGISNTMYEHPSFTSYNKMIKTLVKPEGNTIMLKCKAQGIPAPNITWYKNNETPIKRLIGSTRYGPWYLALEDLVTDDSGTYTCVVCNIVGCINYNFTVSVEERYQNKPIIINPPENKTVVVGSNVSFTCKFLSDLNLQIFWMAGSENGTTIQNSESTENPEILEIYNVTYESEGWYTCVAANALGNTFAGAYLKVVDTLEETLKSPYGSE